MTPPCDNPETAARRRPAEQVDPRAALICVLAFAALQAATPIEEWTRFPAYAALLLSAILWSRVSVRWLLSRLLLAVPFVAAVLLSALLVRPAPAEAIRVAGLAVDRQVLVLAASVAAKATLSILALSLPVALWEFSVLLRAMQSLRVPRLFVMLMGFMWRYLHLLGSEGRRMIQARDSRGAQGGLVRRVLVVGAMTGSLFVRGYERAERIGQAMVGRGYDGTLRLLVPWRRFRLADAAGVLVVVAVLCVIRLV